MTKPARKRAKRKAPELRRDLLLGAGRACLQKHGRTGFSMTKMAREAGVAISLLTHYFGGADELFKAVIQSTISVEKPDRAKKVENLDEACFNLEKLISDSFGRSNFSRENFLLSLAVYEHSLLDAGFRRAFRCEQRRSRAYIAGVLDDVARFRRVKIDAEALADEFLGFVDGLRLKWCLSDRHGTEREVDAATRFLGERLGASLKS